MLTTQCEPICMRPKTFKKIWKVFIGFIAFATVFFRIAPFIKN